MDLKTYWLALRAGWLIVLATVCVFAVGTLVLAWPSAPTYSSTTRLFIAASTDTENLVELSERNAVATARLQSYVELARSGSVADAVGEELGFEVGAGSVSALAIPETVVLALTATAGDPETARDIAAAYSEALPAAIENLEQIRDSGSPQVRAVVIDEAVLPTGPIPSPFVRSLISGIALGLGVGMGIAVLRYALTQGSRPGAHDEPAAT